MAAVYLIPAPLHEDALASLPVYVRRAVLSCEVFFVENERTTRRFFKKLEPSIVIDDYTWIAMKEVTQEVRERFIQTIRANKTIGIVSEAGCPGIADPGQELVAIAHQCKAEVKPLAGPSSIILAFMASGFNGQQFTFHGYLPVDETERAKKIKQLEELSAKINATQIFIETPYRNQKLFDTILKICHPNTKLCVAIDITSPHEQIISISIADWKRLTPNLHKRPAIFLLYRGH